MTLDPFYSDEWLTLHGGDARAVLAQLPAASVDCVVTSPPYWGLRDYGADGQLGQEPTPEAYVANLVAVFREVRRVLKPSGTCWLNLGDSYANGGGIGGQGRTGIIAGTKHDDLQGRGPRVDGLASKQLVGIPWRVAFALQADGWYLRADVIWSKPNPMPESVTDRPTKAHEYVFLLTRSSRYYFDDAAVREPFADARMGNPGGGGGYMRSLYPDDEHAQSGLRAGVWTKGEELGGRNIRSVWTIASTQYAGAHFAVFPPELPERCILAGTSERGVCAQCAAPWVRVVESERVDPRTGLVVTGAWSEGGDPANQHKGGFGPARPEKRSATTGWSLTCGHDEELAPERAVVLDPFAGSGTVGMVANHLSRRAILVDLNPEYLTQAIRRNAQRPLGL